MTTVPQIAIKSFTGGPICVCVCVEWHFWTQKNPGSVAEQRWGWHKHEQVRVPELADHAASARPRVSDRSESLFHVYLVFRCDLCEGVRRGRFQTDLSHYSNVAPRSLRIQGPLYLDTICAPVPHIYAAYFYPFTSIWASYARNFFQNNVQLLRQQQHTWDIFPRYLPRKEQILTFDPGVLNYFSL